MNGAEHAASSSAAGGRTEHAVRPARLDSRIAERRFAELLDDACRQNERASAKLSNAQIGEACEAAESRVRAWRDPHGARPMTAYRLLQLPDAVLRSLLERLLAARAELRGELAPDDTRAAMLVLIGSMARAQAELAQAIASPVEEDVTGPLCAVLRDARTVLARVGRRAAVLVGAVVAMSWGATMVACGPVDEPPGEYRVCCPDGPDGEIPDGCPEDSCDVDE